LAAWAQASSFTYKGNEELGRTTKEVLPCKERHKMFTIGKAKGL